MSSTEPGSSCARPSGPSGRAGAIPCGPDLAAHLDRLEHYERADFDEVYVQQVGPDHDGFFRAYEREILPGYPGGTAGPGARP